MSDLARWWCVTLIALALWGCQAGLSRESLAGTYGIEQPLVSGASEDFAEGLHRSIMDSVTLHLRADGSFHMQMFFPIAGSWSISGQRVVLRAESMMGYRPDSGDEILEFGIEDGGARLRQIDADGNPLVFVRKRSD